MTLFRIKKTLSVVPFVLLLTLAIFVVIYLNYSDESWVTFSLCIILSSVFLFASYIKIEITDFYMSRPHVLKLTKIPWNNIFELKIYKSSISGYTYCLVSYYENNDRNYCTVGSWYGNYKVLFEEIKKMATNAKVVE